MALERTGETDEKPPPERKSREPRGSSDVQENVRIAPDFRGVYVPRAEDSPAGPDAAARREEARTLLIQLLARYVAAKHAQDAEKREAA